METSTPTLMAVKLTYEWQGQEFEVYVNPAQARAVFLDREAAEIFARAAEGQWPPEEIGPPTFDPDDLPPHDSGGKSLIGPDKCYRVVPVGAPAPFRGPFLDTCVCVKCLDCSTICFFCRSAV